MGLTSKDIKRLANQHRTADSVSPRVYVGTYAKYNNGSIAGEWLNLDDYYDHEDFMAAARELHSDEADPELMFSDSDGVPDWAYHESQIEPKFWEFMDATKEWDDSTQEAFQIFIDYYYGDSIDNTDMTEAVDAFEERYRGQYDSVEDYAYQYVEDIGIENLGEDTLMQYFDKEKYVRDLGFEGWHYADEQELPEEDFPEGSGTYEPGGEFYSDERLEDIVEGWLEDNTIPIEQVQNYFDYESFARDLELGGDVYEQSGHIFDGH